MSLSDSFPISNLIKNRTVLTPDDVHKNTQMVLTMNDQADTKILVNLRPDGFFSWEQVSFDSNS